MGKIAVALQEALKRRRERGEAGRAVGRSIAAGQGWSVGDVTCTSGPQDRTIASARSTPMTLQPAARKTDKSSS